MKEFELETYLSKSVKNIVSDILKASFSYPKASLFMLQYKNYSTKATALRKQAEENNDHIPPFLIASITNACNLHCKGCFARANQSCSDDSFGKLLTDHEWNHIFLQAKELGIGFILLAGGEPLLRRDVLEIAGNVPEILFPVFTNATLLNEEYLTLFDKKRNLIPVLSIEGNQGTTDERRGDGIFQQLSHSMNKLMENKILFATSITVTSKNMQEVLSSSFVKQLTTSGCKAIIYVEYVPTNETDKILALDDTARDFMAKRLTEMRQEKNALLFLSFPGDEKSFGGCLAAGRGFFHINAQGGAEPCPFSPYSDTNLTETSLKDALRSPLFTNLSTSGILTKDHIGGCSLYVQDNAVRQALEDVTL